MKSEWVISPSEHRDCGTFKLTRLISRPEEFIHFSRSLIAINFKTVKNLVNTFTGRCLVLGFGMKKSAAGTWSRLPNRHSLFA